MAFFFSRPPAQERIPTDKVLPLHYFEKTHLVKGVNVAIALFVDEVLDPQILKTSLEGLVKRKGWERLGGRLRANAAGEPEWHIPTVFTEDRPPIEFTHRDYGIPSTEHPSAKLIPKPSSKPALVVDQTKLRDLVWDPDYKPTGVSEYMSSDRPVLGLRVNSFTDKTVIVFQWQHVAFDTMGMKYVLEAWCKMLWGREDEILEPLSYETDPFAPMEAGERPVTEKHILEGHLLRLGGVLRWGLGYGVDTFIRAKEDRTLCIPEPYWRSELERALEELREKAAAEGKDVSKVFLTEGDIITSLMWRCNVMSMGLSDDRLVVGTIAMSLRKAFEGDLIPKETEHPLVGNAWGWSSILVKKHEIASNPLSWYAQQVRRAINEQGTKAQHEAYYHLLRESKTVMPINVFGDGTMRQLGLTNWTKADLFGMDFAPARKTPIAGNPPCRPTYAQEHHGPIMPADGVYVLGKDNDGNYWVSATVLAGQWTAFEKVMNEYFEGRV